VINKVLWNIEESRYCRRKGENEKVRKYLTWRRKINVKHKKIERGTWMRWY
jgi:hypothetical protein